MKKVKSVKDSQPTKKKRGPKSGIGYPYYNMEDSVEVARLVHERGGGSCSRDHLASYLGNSSTNSGAFLSRVSAAKMFGLIDSDQGHVSVTELSRNIFAPVMPDDEKRAKVEAFFTVPLFQTVYEEFKGKVLPPPAGLKNLLKTKLKIVKDRVTPAQRVLMESAEYAGFFDTHGDQTRLIEPAMEGTPTQQNKPPEAGKKDDGQPQPPERGKGSGEGGGPPTGIHTAIIGLLRELPPIGKSWETSKKERFFQAFKAIIDVVYPEEKEGES